MARYSAAVREEAFEAWFLSGRRLVDAVRIGKETFGLDIPARLYRTWELSYSWQQKADARLRAVLPLLLERRDLNNELAAVNFSGWLVAVSAGNAVADSGTTSAARLAYESVGIVGKSVMMAREQLPGRRFGITGVPSGPSAASIGGDSAKRLRARLKDRGVIETDGAVVQLDASPSSGAEPDGQSSP